MGDEEKHLIGAWLDGIGTILSAMAEINALSGERNHHVVVIGEGLQAVGTMIIGTVENDDPLDFAGNWIDGVGAATSSYGAYLQAIDVENGDETARLEILGDSFQSMGASMSALADFLQGENLLAFGNTLQGVGAALEAIGGVYELNEKEEGQLMTAIGATIQAIGSNFNAIVVTREFLLQDNRNSI